MNKRFITHAELYQVLRDNLSEANMDAPVIFRIDFDELDQAEAEKGLSIACIDIYHHGTEINIGLDTVVPQYVGKTLIGLE